MDHSSIPWKVINLQFLDVHSLQTKDILFQCPQGLVRLNKQSLEILLIRFLRFISWDLSTSEICRDIDPQVEGIMLGLAVSNDSRWAGAFTR